MYKELTAAAIAAYRSTNKAAARKAIADPSCPAPALYVAAHILLGRDWEEWLLETAEHELVAEGLAPSLGDMLGAVQVTGATGAPWWSYRAFCVAANTFAGYATDTHGYVPPEPEHMAALIPEMTLVFGLASTAEDTVPEYSDEVEAYVAAALAHHGYCCAPPNLSFAQERLDKLVHQHTCARAKKAADESADGAPVKATPPAENVQTERLEAVTAYVNHRLERARDALKALA